MTQSLPQLRQEIDTLDEKLLEILAQRAEVSAQIGKYKTKHQLSVLDQNRWQKVIASRIKSGNKKGLTSDFIHQIFNLIHQYSLSIQKEPER